MASVNRAPRPSSLADVLDVVLDKGIVIDAYVRVALVGIELLTIDARIVIASVDTYLRFAEAVNRLDLTQVGQHETLPELVENLQEGTARKRTRGVLEGAKEKLFGDDDDDDSEGDGKQRRRSSSSSGSRSSGSRSRAASSSSGSKSRTRSRSSSGNSKK